MTRNATCHPTHWVKGSHVAHPKLVQPPSISTLFDTCTTSRNHRFHQCFHGSRRLLVPTIHPK